MQISWRGRGVENRKAVICVTGLDVVDVTKGPSIIRLGCLREDVRVMSGMQRSL